MRRSGCSAILRSKWRRLFLAIRDDNIFAGIFAMVCGNVGIVAGKLSLAIPTILYVLRSAEICTQ